MSQIKINNSKNEPVLYGYFFDGDLRFEFEYYGTEVASMDMEVIYTVKPDDFETFKSAMGIGTAETVEDALNKIAKNKLGDELKSRLLDKSIPNKKFVWMS